MHWFVKLLKLTVAYVVFILAQTLSAASINTMLELLCIKLKRLFDTGGRECMDGGSGNDRQSKTVNDRTNSGGSDDDGSATDVPEDQALLDDADTSVV